jgi:pimeloyl-ACP methyl ester carboxylesterase
MGALSRRRRVLSLDLPGFGLSDPVWPVAPLGRTIAEIVLAWLDAIGVRGCDVVGTSFGGLVALRMAQRRGGPVRQLVLLDSAGLGRELPLVVRLASVPGVGPWLLRPGRAGTRWVFRHLMTADRRAIGPAVEEALIEYLWRSDLAAKREVVIEAYRLFCDLRGQREVLTDAELSALGVSTLVAWGEGDRFLPARHGRRAAARIPGAIYREIRGAGHSPNWEAPDVVVEVVESFLSGASPGLP